MQCMVMCFTTIRFNKCNPIVQKLLGFELINMFFKLLSGQKLGKKDVLFFLWRLLLRV